MKVDYIAMMQEYLGRRKDGLLFLTDSPTVKLSSDAIVEVRYDVQTRIDLREVRYRYTGRLDF